MLFEGPIVFADQSLVQLTVFAAPVPPLARCSPPPPSRTPSIALPTCAVVLCLPLCTCCVYVRVCAVSVLGRWCYSYVNKAITGGELGSRGDTDPRKHDLLWSQLSGEDWVEL